MGDAELRDIVGPLISVVCGLLCYIVGYLVGRWNTQGRSRLKESSYKRKSK